MKFIIEIEPGYNGDYGTAPDIDPETFVNEELYITDGCYTYTIASIEPVKGAE